MTCQNSRASSVYAAPSSQKQGICIFKSEFHLLLPKGFICFVTLVIWCETSFSFLCSKDFLRITDAMGRRHDYCGNKTGQKLLVTGDKMGMTFRSDDKVENRGYYLVFTLVSQASVSSSFPGSHGKIDHKEANPVNQAYLRFPEIQDKKWKTKFQIQYARKDFVINGLGKTAENNHCHEIVASVETDSWILFNPITGLMDFLVRSSLTNGGPGGRRGSCGQYPITLGMFRSYLTRNLGDLIKHPKLFSSNSLSWNGSVILKFTTFNVYKTLKKITKIFTLPIF